LGTRPIASAGTATAVNSADASAILIGVFIVPPCFALDLPTANLDALPLSVERERELVPRIAERLAGLGGERGRAGACGQKS
jgi:hypothetical protein